jgi:hypothetical protein
MLLTLVLVYIFPYCTTEITFYFLVHLIKSVMLYVSTYVVYRVIEIGIRAPISFLF